MLTTSGFTRTAKQIGIHSTTASAFCRANTRASLQSSKFIFLYNETLENNINYVSGIKKIFYKCLSLNKLKMETNPEGVI
jgi:hypothetical protein